METTVTQFHSNGAEKRKISEPVGELDFREAQVTDAEIATTEDINSQAKKLEKHPSQSLAAVKTSPLPGNVKLSPVFTNLEVPSQDPPTNLDQSPHYLPGSASLHPCNRGLESSEKDVGNGSVQFVDEYLETPGPRKRNSKSKTPVTSSRVLRSKTKEKPQAPDQIAAASLHPYNSRLISSEKDVGNDSGQLEDENLETPVKGRKRNSKLKTLVTSSRVSRSKAQEFPHVPDPIGSASLHPCNIRLEPSGKDNSGEFDKHLETTAQEIKRNSKLKGLVPSSLVLSSKPQKKPQTPGPLDTAKEGSATGEKKSRRKKPQTPGALDTSKEGSATGEKKSRRKKPQAPGQLDTSKEGSATGEKKSRRKKPQALGPLDTSKEGSATGEKKSSRKKPQAPGPFNTSKEGSATGEKKSSLKKPQAPGPLDTAKEGSDTGEKKRRRKKTKAIKKTEVDEFSRMRGHLRYLLRRITYEQSLIDAYSAEGWRGQSLEKLKPAKELQRAKSHILRYKLKIRELFRSFDSLLAEGKLPETLFDSEGEIDSEDIFCAKCGTDELPPDNDIILCDGVCDRGFHQLCLNPPLLTRDVPTDDEGWLCPGCDCKADCIGILNDSGEAAISISDNWEKIFPEAAAAASGNYLDGGSGISSDDSEDDDYDPDKPDTVQKVEGDKSSSDESNYVSACDELEASPNNSKLMGFPLDDSEDDDFDPTSPDPDKQVQIESSSSDFSSDSEDLGAMLDEATATCGYSELDSAASDHNLTSAISEEDKDEISYLVETSDEPVAGKRQVERLDYKKLHDETYGGTSSESSDEDYNDSDTSAPKRLKINHEKKTEVTHSNKTPIVKRKKKDTNDASKKQTPHSRKSTRKNNVDEVANNTPETHGTGSTGRSAQKRLGEDVTQKLYVSFKENQYPDKAVKEKLANELGLKVQQVSKWFENARWSFRHRPQTEVTVADKPTTGTGNNDGMDN